MAPVTVAIECLPHGADLPLPAYASVEAAGLDLRAAVADADPIVLEPGERALVPTGLRVALPVGHEGQIRPRSGLALRHGVTVLNSPGTIDADYRGEVGVVLVNLGRETFVIRRADRIAQLVVTPVTRVDWALAPLSETVRGVGGFGSTGRSDQAEGRKEDGC